MVVGGGDSAMEEALYLSRLGRKVAGRPPARHVCAPRRSCRTGPSRTRRSSSSGTPRSTTSSRRRRARSTGVRLRNLKTGRPIRRRQVDGLFVAIGHEPNTAVFRGQIELHPNDYVKVEAGHDADLGAPACSRRATSQDFTYRQAVTAAGTGCMAALEAERYLEAAERARSARSTDTGATPQLQFLGSGDAFGSGGRFQTCLHLSGPDRAPPPGLRRLVARGDEARRRRSGHDRLGVPEPPARRPLRRGAVPDPRRPVLAADAAARDRRPARRAGAGRGGDRGALPRLDAHRAPFTTEFVELPPRAPTPVGPATVIGSPRRARQWSAVLRAPGRMGRAASWPTRATPNGRRAWSRPPAAPTCFVCEAYFFEKTIRYHLDYRTLAAQRRSTGLPPARRHPHERRHAGAPAEADVECAEDGLVVDL